MVLPGPRFFLWSGLRQGQQRAAAASTGNNPHSQQQQQQRLELLGVSHTDAWEDDGVYYVPAPPPPRRPRRQPPPDPDAPRRTKLDAGGSGKRRARGDADGGGINGRRGSVDDGTGAAGERAFSTRQEDQQLPFPLTKRRTGQRQPRNGRTVSCLLGCIWPAPACPPLQFGPPLIASLPPNHPPTPPNPPHPTTSRLVPPHPHRASSAAPSCPCRRLMHQTAARMRRATWHAWRSVGVAPHVHGLLGGGGVWVAPPLSPSQPLKSSGATPHPQPTKPHLHKPTKPQTHNQPTNQPTHATHTQPPPHTHTQARDARDLLSLRGPHPLSPSEGRFMVLWNAHSRDPSNPRPLCDGIMPPAAAGFIDAHRAELRRDGALRRVLVAHLMTLGEYALVSPAQLGALLRKLNGCDGDDDKAALAIWRGASVTRPKAKAPPPPQPAVAEAAAAAAAPLRVSARQRMRRGWAPSVNSSGGGGSSKGPSTSPVEATAAAAAAAAAAADKVQSPVAAAEGVAQLPAQLFQ